MINSRAVKFTMPVFLAAALFAGTRSPAAPAGASEVQVVRDDAHQRVDILIGGQPFTSYIYPDTIKKPVLFPLRTAAGTVVTRGFPPGPGERADHPHHVGLWFNYSNVNGYDFWNNSDAIKPEARAHYGTIFERAIVSAKSGHSQGELETRSDWVIPDGTTLIKQDTRYVFRGGPGMRSIDFIATLTAQDQVVVFRDDKDGLLGMRVRRELEMPSTEPGIFTDAAGNVTKVPPMDNSIVTGNYLTSEGISGDAAWSTRGRWCILTGKIAAEPVTIAIFDHPKNPNAPTYWHARGYGLFAANPFGAKDFTAGKETLNYTLQPHQSITFHYRILILSETATPAEIEKLYQGFLTTYP
jgi:methane monooxygenase PmoA-like